MGVVYFLRVSEQKGLAKKFRRVKDSTRQIPYCTIIGFNSVYNYCSKYLIEKKNRKKNFYKHLKKKNWENTSTRVKVVAMSRVKVTTACTVLLSCGWLLAAATTSASGTRRVRRTHPGHDILLLILFF